MPRLRLPLMLLLVSLGGCAAQSPPNADLTLPGASVVTVDGWQLEARGEFLDPERVQVRIDLLIRKVGDPSRVIASPTMTTIVGEDSVIESAGNGNDVTCSVSTVRKGSGVQVTVTSVITRDGRAVSRPSLRFNLD